MDKRNTVNKTRLLKTQYIAQKQDHKFTISNTLFDFTNNACYR